MRKPPTIKTRQHLTLLPLIEIFRNIPNIHGFHPRRNIELTYSLITDAILDFKPALFDGCINTSPDTAYISRGIGRLKFTETVTDNNAHTVMRRIQSLLEDGVTSPSLTRVLNHANPFLESGWSIHQSTHAKNMLIVSNTWVYVDNKPHSYDLYVNKILPKLIKTHTHRNLTLEAIHARIIHMRGLDLVTGGYDDIINKFNTPNPVYRKTVRYTRAS